MKRYYGVVILIIAFIITGFWLGKKLIWDINKTVSFSYPFGNALFPPEFPPPVFRWVCQTCDSPLWKIELTSPMSDFSIVDTVSGNSYQPALDDWEKLKRTSGFRKIRARLSELASERKMRGKALTKLHFRFSNDSVGAPILYREIPLPFVFAEANPDSMSYRLVDVGSVNPPHTVMKKFMVCGNCHSSSNNGKIIGLDFDAAHRDKGGYFIAELSDSIVFDTSNYLSWNKMQDQKTFGMFSKVSPNGRYVATTISDRVIAHNFGYDVERLPFSQLFFPVNGVLAIYDRETGKLKELTGADLPEYVQSNSFWTPDGEFILFVRAKALPYEENEWDMLLNDRKIIDDFVYGRRDFKFDICKIPFNNGEGGVAEPVRGASQNGMSNYFPAVSPDGRWLIFCQADNYMLLMPDSRLYIVPLEGGKARKLECNLPLMNSWHAWSPNSKWVVYISKGLSIYSDMFLTHIDNRGHASIPVLLENARKDRRVANYPEFINIDPGYKFNMIYKYVDIAHIRRALMAGDTLLAKQLYDQFIAQDQYSLASEYLFLGRFNLEQKQYREAARFFKLAYEKDPGDDEIRVLYPMFKGLCE